jgi:hypothetical protein
MPPSRLWGSLGNAFEPFFLFSCVLTFIFGVVGLPPHHILKQGDPLRVTAHTSQTLQHERNGRKKGKNQHNQAEISPSGLTQGLMTLSLKGTGLEPECRFIPRARILWTRVSTSASGNSVKKERPG